jgi:hypothetical protein
MSDSSSSFPSIDREYDTLTGSNGSPSSPERRLLLAILERAILDLVGNDSKEVEEAEDWLFAESEVPYAIFSFGWLCEQLDLDRVKIAQKIRSMPRRGNHKVAPWYFMKTVGHSNATEKATCH